MYIIIVAVYIVCTITLYVKHSRNVDRIKNIYEDINKDQDKKIQDLKEDNKLLNSKITLMTRGYKRIPPSIKGMGYTRQYTEEEFEYYEIDYCVAKINKFSNSASVVISKKDTFGRKEDAENELKHYVEERNRNIKAIIEKENYETKKTNKA